MLLILYFDRDFLLEVVREFSFLTYSIVMTIGLVQGYILGQAIVDRFPRLQFHTRLTLVMLLVLFVTHAIVSIMRFAEPEKMDLLQMFASKSSDLGPLILRAMGLNSDIGTIIAFSITAVVLVILKLTGLKGYSKYYVLIISIIMLIITAMLKFSDYQPGSFEILLFILYNASMTAGLLWGTRKRLYSMELKNRNFVDWWTGKSGT
ncbi:MAG: hypothetical protein QXU32_11815 [Nitrososphaerales archaeon]